MTTGMASMWLSFVAMGLMIASALLIMFSRAKVTGMIRYLLSLIAYAMFIIGGLLMFLVVISGPV
ncbi:DUF2768 domain-containing protein [Tuberibacillus calidus]|jgi:hypothetical protein|uniref:DUF2768 domain-containing protein n=1 Tax=Tuberibacillus calidus TaxID=340097 RepID=UPI00042A6D2A|nr:DUF2768 domain-containing protein [Tuberibacillus calidus]